MYGYEVRKSECKAMTACTGVKWESEQHACV